MKIKPIPENKKGDIPTTLLVIGVIALCGLAIFIFLNSLNQTRGSIEYIGEMEKANKRIEEGSLEEYSQEVDETDFRMNFDDWKEKKVVFSVDYSSP